MLDYGHLPYVCLPLFHSLSFIDCQLTATSKEREREKKGMSSAQFLFLMYVNMGVVSKQAPGAEHSIKFTTLFI
jgi:hypothetical protein